MEDQYSETVGAEGPQCMPLGEFNFGLVLVCSQGVNAQ